MYMSAHGLGVKVDATACFCFADWMQERWPATVEAWIALQSASRTVLERIESALKRAGLPPLGCYDALLEIEKAGPEGVRPFALTERLLLPQYGTSRLLDRIEKAGLIKRLACDDDGRGQVVVITEQGRAMRNKMWPLYAEELRRGVEQKLAPSEIETLAQLLRKLN